MSATHNSEFWVLWPDAQWTYEKPRPVAKTIHVFLIPFDLFWKICMINPQSIGNGCVQCTEIGVEKTPNSIVNSS